MSTLIVLAKEPVAGRVKTRLCPPFTLEQAAGLAEASLRDTLAAARASCAADRLLFLAGEPGAWLPDGFDVLPQPGGGLDERIAAAFVAVAEAARSTDLDDADPGPALLIGMDTPQVTAHLLDSALNALRDGADAAFGPAEDGGFWALGFSGRWLRAKDALERMLLGVPMSQDDTGRVQLRRLIEEGLDIELLPPLRDIDTAADAHHVAALAPDGAFAARLAEMQGPQIPDPRTAEAGPEIEGPAKTFGAMDYSLAEHSVERDFGDWGGAVSSSYERALWGCLSGSALPVMLQDEGGGVAFQLDVAKYHGAADPVDAGLLSRCTGPTLDIGCGPGRLAAELAQRGIPALGVDVAPVAVLLARAAGATVLRRSVFERLPGEGRWPHALLIDGNIGIGGDPGALLRRIKDVLRPWGGELLVEVAAEEVDERLTLRVAGHGAPIAWARLGIAALQSVAHPLGYTLAAQWIADGRHFAALAT